MATIKIIAEKNENFEEIENFLFKAIQSKQDSKFFESRFDDPLMNTLSEMLDYEYTSMYGDLIKDIMEVLKK